MAAVCVARGGTKAHHPDPDTPEPKSIHEPGFCLLELVTLEMFRIKIKGTFADLDGHLLPSGVSDNGGALDTVCVATDQVEVIPERPQPLPAVEFAQINQQPDVLMFSKEAVQILDVILVLFGVEFPQKRQVQHTIAQIFLLNTAEAFAQPAAGLLQFTQFEGRA